jgi:uncharacterized coiled-coil protein SlyX
MAASKEASKLERTVTRQKARVAKLSARLGVVERRQQAIIKKAEATIGKARAAWGTEQDKLHKLSDRLLELRTRESQSKVARNPPPAKGRASWEMPYLIEAPPDGKRGVEKLAREVERLEGILRDWPRPFSELALHQRSEVRARLAKEKAYLELARYELAHAGQTVDPLTGSEHSRLRAALNRSYDGRDYRED